MPAVPIKFRYDDARYSIARCIEVLSLVITPMNPYARPDERKVGTRRPKISHLPRPVDVRTRTQRRAEKEAVAAERRAIKKSARRHLKQQLREELLDT